MRDVVATLRSAAGCNPCDRDWARHDARFHISGVKRLHCGEVGDLELNYEPSRSPSTPA